VSEVLWLFSEGGADHCVLEPSGRGHRLRGVALLAVEGKPVEARYSILADGSWRTEEVSVAIEFPGGDVREPVELGKLWAGGDRPPELRDCVDVDLGFTPATNTLPIRRLGLAVGESAEVAAAWLRWPELTVERLEQRYERLARRRYRYSSGRFSAELVVGDDGLVLEYGDYWRAVASTA
jgi:uncharacterized protein